MPIEPIDPRVTTFSGEGITRSLRQGGAAIAGVAAHEALNLVVLKGQAIRAGAEVVGEEVEVRFGIDPETGRVEVVGGRSRLTFRSASARAEPEQSGGAAPGAEPRGGPKTGTASTADGEDRETDEALRAIEQAQAAVERRLAEAEDARRLATEPVEQQRADTTVRSLKRKQADLEAARRLLEMEQESRRLADMLDLAVNAPTDIAFRVGAAAAGGTKTGKAGHSGAAPRPGGVFIPAMTLSGLLVNTGA